jgi:glycosyltransferase involved in cell wall biosynthesis
MAETLVAHGCDTLVASAVDREVVFGGVRYAPVAAAAGARCDLLALVNSWGDVAETVRARRRVFLYYDTRTGGSPDTPRCVGWADRTLVNSPFGRDQLVVGRLNGAADRVGVIPIPVRLSDYADAPLERGNRLLYSSMPDRGLIHLARWFPRIRARVPTAELHVTGDFTMYGWPGARADYERLFHGTPGVVYHGRVSRSELVELQRSAKVLAFPCTFPEGFCIAAAEAMAAGAVPVTSGAFALSTTVGPAGVLVRGHPGGGRRRTVQQWLYGRRFVRAVVRLLTDPAHWRAKSEACRQAGGRFAPDAWHEQFTRLLSEPPIGKVAC